MTRTSSIQGVALAALVCASAIAGAQQPSGRGRGGAPTGPQLLHPMFQDHGVLQRDRPIRIYGDTAAGAAVTVTLGDASVQARAGADGRWTATLPPMAAGGPYSLTASANGETK